VEAHGLAALDATIEPLHDEGVLVVVRKQLHFRCRDAEEVGGAHHEELDQFAIRDPLHLGLEQMGGAVGTRRLVPAVAMPRERELSLRPAQRELPGSGNGVVVPRRVVRPEHADAVGDLRIAHASPA
jgi:hypothetical protein